MQDSFGRRKRAPVGFSWTMLFFGILAPLFRGDFKWFFIMILLDILTAGLAWFVFPFFYNEWYYKDLINKGYKSI